MVLLTESYFCAKEKFTPVENGRIGFVVSQVSSAAADEIWGTRLLWYSILTLRGG